VIGIFRVQLCGAAVQTFLRVRRSLRTGHDDDSDHARSTEEFLKSVPRMLREGAMALGASKWKTIVTVIVPRRTGAS